MYISQDLLLRKYCYNVSCMIVIIKQFFLHCHCRKQGYIPSNYVKKKFDLEIYE